MKVVVACDSFKGSLCSMEAGEAIKSGVLKAIPTAEVCVRPLADGGEGTVEALTLGMGGKIESVEVTGTLGEKVNCRYGILEESKTAIMEMAGAAGITLVPAEKRNPLHTETNLENYVKDADVVVTGEGRLDGQSIFGKAPIGVAKIAKKYDKKVIAFAGVITEDTVEQVFRLLAL